MLQLAEVEITVCLSRWLFHNNALSFISWFSCTGEEQRVVTVVNFHKSTTTSCNPPFCLIKMNCNDNELPNLIFLYKLWVRGSRQGWEELVKFQILPEATKDTVTAHYVCVWQCKLIGKRDNHLQPLYDNSVTTQPWHKTDETYFPNVKSDST